MSTAEQIYRGVTLLLTCAMLVLAVLHVRLLADVRELECDVHRAVFVEREYTYPGLRALGHNPDDYGLGIDNPLTTKLRYSNACD